MGGDPDDLPPDYQHIVPHAQMLLPPPPPGPGLLGDVSGHLTDSDPAALMEGLGAHGEDQQGGAEGSTVAPNPTTPLGPLDTSVGLPKFRQRPEVAQAMTLQQTQRDLADPQVQALLAMMRGGEGGDHYDAIVNSAKGFKDFSKHPNVSVLISPARPGADGKMKPEVTSTAAGSYQFTKGTWDQAAQALGLTDFQPRSQDLAAAYYLRTLGATDKLGAGDIEGAMHAAGKRWQIFPKSNGEAISAPGQTPRRPSMAPLLKAYGDKLRGLQR
jgi:muramidase (phage lysozyme)